jgi:mannan endo-1,4-beta-mannosidase
MFTPSPLVARVLLAVALMLVPVSAASGRTKLSSPRGLSVTATAATSISMSWRTSPGAAGYMTYVGSMQVGTATTTSFTATSLDCGTTYSLGVASYDTSGKVSTVARMGASTSACPSTADSLPPTLPSQLAAASATPTSVSLTWAGSSDNLGVVGYGVYTNGVSAGTSTLTSYTVSGLACGTSYSFGVDAYDAAGNRSSKAPLSASTSACATPSPPSPPPPSPSSAFVTRLGTKLYLNGQQYRFTGLNFFQANMTSGIANCSSWAANSDLDSQLTAMGPGHNVIRAWFFQNMATRNGTRDWTAFDHTFAVAKAHGYKVIATLADQWDYCEGPYKDKSWYGGGYRTSVLPGNTVPYRTWVQEVASRYKDDPTVAIWELVNEAEDAPSAPCPSDAEQVMYSFASDVSGLIKSIDPNHLVSLGGGGNGNCGTLDTDFAKVMAIPSLDICSVHDYYGASVTLSSDPNNGTQKRISDCNALSKPTYTGESGIKVQDVSSLAERASEFRNKLNAQIGAGESGFVAWNWYRASDIDYRIGPGDPALTTVSTLALP